MRSPKAENVMSFRVNDAVIISHPRSGLTWMRWMLFELRKLTDWELVPGGEHANQFVRFDHDRVGLKTTSKKRFEDLLRRKVSRWADLRVVFLVRDPRDVVNSNYRRLVLRGDVPRLQGLCFDAFIRHPVYGVDALCRWLGWWEDHAPMCKGFLPVFYEETVADPAAVLKLVSEYLTGECYDQEVYEAAANASSIDRMRAYEAENGRVLVGQDGAIPGMPETALVRRGEVGQWREWNDQDVEYACDVVNRRLWNSLVFGVYAQQLVTRTRSDEQVD